jgi:hypothetical protein
LHAVRPDPDYSGKHCRRPLMQRSTLIHKTIGTDEKKSREPCTGTRSIGIYRDRASGRRTSPATAGDGPGRKMALSIRLSRLEFACRAAITAYRAVAPFHLGINRSRSTRTNGKYREQRNCRNQGEGFSRHD